MLSRCRNSIRISYRKSASQFFFNVLYVHLVEFFESQRKQEGVIVSRLPEAIYLRVRQLEVEALELTVNTLVEVVG